MAYKKIDIAIIGAGLSGLATALLLSEAGKEVCLLEARNTAGGRIRSVFDEAGKNHLADLGPTWVWPQFQPVITNWIDKLGLEVFPQFDTGNAKLDYGPDTVPEARFLPSQQGNMRVVGGSQALVDEMVIRLPDDALITNTKVEIVDANKNTIRIHTNNSKHEVILAKNLIIATPPRIALKTIEWKIELPSELNNALDMTPTWMAPHAKVSIVYENAFWRHQGLSGRIASHAGPIVESHDHCSANGSTAALWGFIGWPHDIRIDMGEEVLKLKVLEQLKRCFGNDSPDPLSITIEEWSQDPYVTSPNDLLGPMEHPNIGPDSLRFGYHDNRIWFASAETAEQSPGLIEGAFVSANRVAAQILNN